MYKTRTATKAVIINDNRILLIENLINDQLLYVVPGGGLDHNESLEEGMKRECLEEVGARVKVGDVLFVRDYIADRHDTIAAPGFHQVEVFFRCELESEINLDFACEMDHYQIGLKWADVDTLKEINFQPAGLKDALIDLMAGKESKIYVGDIV